MMAVVKIADGLGILCGNFEVADQATGHISWARIVSSNSTQVILKGFVFHAGRQFIAPFSSQMKPNLRRPFRISIYHGRTCVFFCMMRLGADSSML